MYVLFTNYNDFNRRRMQRLEERKLKRSSEEFSYFNPQSPHSSEIDSTRI